MKKAGIDNSASRKDGASLIERAAQVYDFRAGMASASEDDDASDGSGGGNGAAGTNGQRDAEGNSGPLVLYRRPIEVDREVLGEMGYILPDTLPTGLAEEFRIVKRHLLNAAATIADGRSILVCSAEPDEGKTFCAVNLALSLAQEKDFEILLVDADFSKPEILSTLGIEGGRGLMDALVDPSIDVESCIIRTDIGGLSVLPAGCMVNEATEILASEYTRTVFARLLANPSRIVIFDSAPALAASSASVLASLVGQILFVVRADVTGDPEMREALSLLAGCQHIRLLLNDAQLAGQGRRFGSYYGYGG